MEIETAARKMLLEQATIRGYVGGDGVYKFKLQSHVDQQGTRRIVVRRSGGWGQPDRVQSSEFPTLAVDSWADCSRPGPGQPAIEYDCIDNAWALFRAVDPLFHRIRNAWWGAYGAHEGLRIFESTRYREPFAQTKDDSHGGTTYGAGGMAYGVKMGESCVVSAEYAIWCAH